MTFDGPTVVFQAVNFIVLVAILWRILWTPLRRHMQDRADRIAAGLAEIDVGRSGLKSLQDETAKLLEEARTAKADAVRQAEIEVNRRRAALLESARQAAVDERDRILAQVANDQQRREQEFLGSLAPVIGRVLESLMREIGGAKLHDLACDQFADWLMALPTEERNRLNVAIAEGQPLDVATATGTLTPRVVKSLESLAAASGPLPLHADPPLIAGVRLRIGETVMDGSVRAQIERVLRQTSPGEAS